LRFVNLHVRYQVSNYRHLCVTHLIFISPDAAAGFSIQSLSPSFRGILQSKREDQHWVAAVILILMTLPYCRNACAAVLKLIAVTPQSNHDDSGTDATGESCGASP